MASVGGRPFTTQALRTFATYWLTILGSIFGAVLLYTIWQFNQFAFGIQRIALFYLVPLALLVVCFFSAAKSWAPRAAIGITLLWAVAYGAEILFAYRGLLDWQEIFRNADPRSPTEVAHTLRGNGLDAWPSFYQSTALRWEDGIGEKEPIALGGVANARTVHCTEGLSSYVVYESDQFGFLNHPDVYAGRTLDIMVVGDSYVHGYCVEVNERIVSQLRKYVPFSANFGISGNGPLLELAIVREYVPYLRPRFVVWSFYEGNDLIDLDGEQYFSALTSYLFPGHRLALAERRAEVDHRLRAYLRNNMSRSERPALFSSRKLKEGMLHFMSLANTWRFAGLPYGSVGHDYNLMEKVLRRARDDIASAGGEMLFLYIPDTKALQGLGLYTASHGYVRQRILGIARDLELPVIDVYPTIVELGGYAAVSDAVGAHFNSRGYALVADLLVDFLCSSGRANQMSSARCPDGRGRR
jgi:hypothetical protein